MIDRNKMAMRVAAAQFAISTLLPDNVNTIHGATVNDEILIITVSNRRKPTKKERRACKKLLHLTPVINGVQWDEWVGFAISIYGIPVELRWKRLRAGELKASIARILSNLHALDDLNDLDSDVEWTGDDDDITDMLGVI